MSSFLKSASSDDDGAFLRLIEPHRAELRAHCYRMLGSVHDADDMVQETLLRAWKGYGGFAARSSLRHWLYRIATNLCLNALARRASRQRLLPQALGAPTDRMPEGRPAADLPWLEPFPDAGWEGVADLAPGPDARYASRESVRLAFVAAIQHLPPRQRAVLLLRDVIGWSARETASALKLTVASVTSALQRARGTLTVQFPEGLPEKDLTANPAERRLVQRYVEAWENADLPGLISLLQEDATLAMPPWTQWYRGRAAIQRFLGWAFDWAWRSRKRATFHVVESSANGQVALALYFRGRGESEYRAHALQLPAFAGRSISGLTFFIGPTSFADLGLPLSLPLGARSPKRSARARS